MGPIWFAFRGQGGLFGKSLRCPLSLSWLHQLSDRNLTRIRP